MRALDPVLVVEDDSILAAGLRGHHRRFRACGQLARVHRMLGPQGEPDRDGVGPDADGLELGQSPHDSLRDVCRVDRVARGHDHAELLAAQAADDVLGPHAGAQRIGEQAQELVADAVAVHVVDALEVVDVEHQHGNGAMRSARILKRVQ